MIDFDAARRDDAVELKLFVFHRSCLCWLAAQWPGAQRAALGPHARSL